MKTEKNNKIKLSEDATQEILEEFPCTAEKARKNNKPYRVRHSTFWNKDYSSGKSCSRLKCVYFYIFPDQTVWKTKPVEI